MTPQGQRKALRDALDEQEFYEAMQGYRHAPLSNQDEVLEKFEAVKCLVIDIAKPLLDELEASRAAVAELVASLAFASGALWDSGKNAHAREIDAIIEKHKDRT